jgi:hypothetical protein
MLRISYEPWVDRVILPEITHQMGFEGGNGHL